MSMLKTVKALEGKIVKEVTDNVLDLHRYVLGPYNVQVETTAMMAEEIKEIQGRII